MIVFLTRALFIAVLWSVDVWLLPAGVKVNVRSNFVGTKTDVLPMMWAGVNVPFPFVTAVIVRVPHVA